MLFVCNEADYVIPPDTMKRISAEMKSLNCMIYVSRFKSKLTISDV